MQHLIKEMGIPTLWHKPILLALWFTVVWVIARIIRGQFKAIFRAVQKTDGRAQLASATFEITSLPTIKINTTP